MAVTFEIQQPFSSPYKSTRLFIKGGRAFFGIWQPVVVTLDGDEDQIIVQEGNEGQLDLVADEYYKDRRLWWVIAQVNKIDFPLRDVVPGLRLIIPKAANVRAALLATLARQQASE